MCAWLNLGSRTAVESARDVERRGLCLLLEGAAIHQAQIDADAYRRFRSAILRDSIRLAEPQSEADLLQTISMVVREFEMYRNQSETALEGRSKEWRHTVGMLMHLLAGQNKIDREAQTWKAISADLESAVTFEEIRSLREKLQRTFLQSEEEAAPGKAKIEEEQDRSIANDNAAGLRGGGAAIEHLRAMLAASRPGYIGLFRLNCLDVVGERFGPEGIQDCLMAVSAFLIENLRAEDTVYHWSESSLLAVCDRKIREDILSAELNRVLARNRDFTIQIGDRTIMLRIPIELELFPVTLFESANDLQKLSASRGRIDRSLAEKAVARLNS